MIITKAPIYMIMFVSGSMGHFIAQVLLAIKENNLGHFNIDSKGGCHDLQYAKNENFCYVRMHNNKYALLENKNFIDIAYDVSKNLHLINRKKEIDKLTFEKNFIVPKKTKPDVFYITNKVKPWYLTLNHFHYTEYEYYDNFENTINQFPNLKFLIIKSRQTDLKLLSVLKRYKDNTHTTTEEKAQKDVDSIFNRQNNMLNYLDKKLIAYTTIEFRDIITNPLLCYNIICDYLGENSKLQQDILNKWNEYLSLNEKLYGKL